MSLIILTAETWIKSNSLYLIQVVTKASFTDLDTLRQMGLVSLIYNGNHQLCLKFSCAGTGITFNGSMDSALIIAAIKHQMTVDNIGLHGMISPMGGMMVKDYDYDFIVWSNGGLKFGVNELSQIELIPVDHFETEESIELIFIEPLRLPTVSMRNDFLSPETTNNSNWVNLVNEQSTAITMPANDIKTAYVHTTTFNYDDTKSYGVIQWQTTEGTLAGRVEVSVVNNSGLIAVKNVSSSSISILQARIAICSSSSATVITVYDSSNNPYNAFKYTSDGTDYYYVLDGTQNDWTDDLSSIGYHVPPAIDELEIIVGVRWDPSNSEWLAKTFSGASDWWWCGILNQSDVFDLTELGVGIVTKSDVTAQWNGQIGAVEFNPNFDYSVEAMYSDLGQTQVTFNRDEFFIISKTSTGGNYDDSCLIHSLYTTSTSVMAYKLKIKRGGNQNSCLYLQSDPLSMAESQWYPLYKMTGSPVEFTTQPSNVLGYFSAANEYDSLHLIPSGFTIEFRNNNNYLEVRQTNSLSQALNAAKIVVVWPSPAPALPTVTKKTAQPFPYNSYINLSAGSESDLYVYDSGSYRALGYDSNNLYSIYGCHSDTYYGGQGWIRGVLFDTVISQNLLKAKNITGSTIPYIDYFSVAVCSSNLATVVTVYNGSNVAYNAFQYTSDGTDYYYVLDGTQTDWTDDLASIGYSLQQIYTAYFKSDKSDETLNYTRDYLSMYGGNGSRMPCEQGTTLTITGFFKSDGTHATRSDGGEIGSGLIIAPINYSGSYVVGYYYGYTSVTSTIAYITYTVS